MKINANEHVGHAFPPDAGKRLASALLKQPDLSWDDLEIDVRWLPPALLISAFFNGFLQQVYATNPDILPKARQVRWLLRFAFQNANFEKWMVSFQPVIRGATV